MCVPLESIRLELSKYELRLSPLSKSTKTKIGRIIMVNPQINIKNEIKAGFSNSAFPYKLLHFIPTRPAQDRISQPRRYQTFNLARFLHEYKGNTAIS